MITLFILALLIAAIVCAILALAGMASRFNLCALGVLFLGIALLLSRAVV